MNCVAPTLPTDLSITSNSDFHTYVCMYVNMLALESMRYLKFSYGFSSKCFTCVIAMFDASRVAGLPPKSVKTAISFSDFKIKTNKSVKKSSFEEAIQALNNLQSNAVTIQKSIQSQRNHLTDTRKYLQRIGISNENLDKLSVIHVSGTKGKGSTCALTESILRSFEVKTGFFSSPHLISVVERIRINGQPISREMFAKYFWQVYKILDELKENDDDMPPYFKFLTILCFRVFIDEKVDVAIIEVGIGGENDCTNVVRNTKTVGITSLGLEHTNLLGNTLEEIAWQKAGIIKPNSSVFTCSQLEECLKVIKERAIEKEAKLFIVPEFKKYKWARQCHPPIENKVQQLNASIAIQLAYDWLKKNEIKKLNGLKDKLFQNNVVLDVCEKVVQGLETFFWPGRYQVVEIRNKRFFLDGAHTKESIEMCRDWFIKSTANCKNKKFLIFNTTGDRDSKHLLQLLSKDINFTKALFVTNTPFKHKKTDDINSSWYPLDQQMQRVTVNFQFWTSTHGANTARKFDDILEALTYLHHNLSNERDHVNNDNVKVDVLVTGSLHLIGATLLALEEYENSNK